MSDEDQFVFRKTDEIGAADAADDSAFLSECFVDTGDLETLLNCQSAKRIVVGRTGAGKTALLTTVQNNTDNVSEISPHTLSLNYIADSTIIKFFEDAGLNLTPYYSLLWKHIFVVELLKLKYHITSQDTQRQCMARLRSLLKKDSIKELAIDYLETWGDKFWLQTEERLRELTSRIEGELRTSMEGSAFGLATASTEAHGALSREQKQEIVERGKQAVSKIQIRELENIINVLNEHVFCDRQEHFYLTIDALDEEWAEDRIRFRLIKSLIETVKKFKKVKNIKILVALRQDLLEKVLQHTQDPGFQEEKYESLYLKIRWTDNQLKELLEKRLNSLIKRRYTKQSIPPEDLFPEKIDKIDPIDYMISRTFKRPRDLILFTNECIEQAEERATFTAEIIKHAEEIYSQKRLQSIAFEWKLIHPDLKSIINFFHGFPERFSVSDITKEFIEVQYTEAAQEISEENRDPLTIALDKLYSGQGNFNRTRNTIISTLHYVGVLGIKRDGTSSVNWAHETQISIAPSQLKPSTKLHIHPMFYRALAVRVRGASTYT